MAKPLLYLWEGGDENPYATVKLDRESRKYIHVRLDNRVRELNEAGKYKTTHNYYEFEECSEEMF